MLRRLLSTFRAVLAPWRYCRFGGLSLFYRTTYIARCANTRSSDGHQLAAAKPPLYKPIYHIRMCVVATLKFRVLSALRGHFIDARWTFRLIFPLLYPPSLTSPGEDLPGDLLRGSRGRLRAVECQTSLTLARWPVSKQETLFPKARASHKLEINTQCDMYCIYYSLIRKIPAFN